MRDYEDMKMHVLEFLVTEDCNLNCVYCYEKHKAPKTLSVNFMKKRIQERMVADDGYEELSIEFFGGEPLLEYEAIRDVIEWFHQTRWPKSAKAYRFVITTNGTLLNDGMKDWFSKFRHSVTLCLSMDGTREAHNRNRSNSYDAVVRHIDFFKNNWPWQPVKMTVSPYTLDQMYAGVVHIHELGLPVESNVVIEDVWGNEEIKKHALRIYAEQLDKLVKFYHMKPDLPRPEMLFHNLLRLFGSRSEESKRTFCGAGKHMTCWAADGRKYPCMRFAPICTSRPLENIDPSGHNKVNEKCETCVFESLCHTCEGYNYEVTGSCFARTDFHCDFFKLELLASAKLYILDERENLLRYNFRSESKKENLNRLRKLLAIKAITDLCGDLIGC